MVAILAMVARPLYTPCFTRLTLEEYPNIWVSPKYTRLCAAACGVCWWGARATAQGVLLCQTSCGVLPCHKTSVSQDLLCHKVLPCHKTSVSQDDLGSACCCVARYASCPLPPPTTSYHLLPPPLALYNKDARGWCMRLVLASWLVDSACGALWRLVLAVARQCFWCTCGLVLPFDTH